MLQVKRSTVVPGALSIFSFAPQQAGPLTLLTIQGQGFSPIPANNTVRIGGVAATVVAATANSLTLSVPATAKTGLITLTVGGSTVSSGGAFTVVAAPAIASIKPRAAIIGTSATVTVTGANLGGATFSLLPSYNPPAITINAVSVGQAGASAILDLTIGPKATGTFVLVASNPFGSSSAFSTSANSLAVIGSNASSMDSDNDGLSDAQEVAIGNRST